MKFEVSKAVNIQSRFSGLWRRVNVVVGYMKMEEAWSFEMLISCRKTTWRHNRGDHYLKRLKHAIHNSNQLSRLHN